MRTNAVRYNKLDIGPFSGYGAHIAGMRKLCMGQKDKGWFRLAEKLFQIRHDRCRMEVRAGIEDQRLPVVQQHIDPHCLAPAIRTADALADLVQISGDMNCHQTSSPATAGIASAFAAIRTTKNQLRKAAYWLAPAKFFATRQIALT